MLDNIFWIVSIALAYIIVSNTIWLLFGSKVIQYLPGVDTNGGTIRIAIMIFLSAVGIFFWIGKYVLSLIFIKKVKPILSKEIGIIIQKGSKIVNTKIKKL